MLKDIEGKVGQVINIDSEPLEPWTDNLEQLYEPLQKSFLGEHRDKCNVLFKVKVRLLINLIWSPWLYLRTVCPSACSDLPSLRYDMYG